MFFVSMVVVADVVVVIVVVVVVVAAVVIVFICFCWVSVARKKSHLWSRASFQMTSASHALKCKKVSVFYAKTMNMLTNKPAETLGFLRFKEVYYININKKFTQRGCWIYQKKGAVLRGGLKNMSLRAILGPFFIFLFRGPDLQNHSECI